MHFLQTIAEQIMRIIEHLGYWGVGIGMMIESACIPLPSELVLPIGGILVKNSGFDIIGMNIAANVGSMIGSVIAYLVGYYGGGPFIIKYGKYFFVSVAHFHKAERTFNKFGTVAVFFGRLLPVIRTFISLPAGISKMNFGKFLIYSLIGMIPWNAFLIWLGFYFGNKETYDKIVGPYYKLFEYGVVGGVILIIGFLVIKYIAHNKKKEK